MASRISEITDHVDAGKGTRLFFRDSRIENERGGALIVHGLAEHSGRYAHITEMLATIGIRTFAYDHRGHGESTGKRGHITRFSEYTNDLELMIEKSRNALSPQVPLFLIGHSMGGLIVLNYIQQHGNKKIDGLIVSSPGLGVAVKPPASKEIAARIMSRVAPGFSFDNELNPQYLSHNQKSIDAYLNDPLIHRRITARWVTEFMKTGEQTCNRADCITLPVLMQVAGGDRIVSPEVSRDFYENISSQDKTLHFYDELHHEIYNESDSLREQVMEDLKTWINDHA